MNVENSVAASAICLCHGVDGQKLRHAIGTFQGAVRRLDEHVNNGTITYIDDYAHHPTEIKATMKAALSIEKKTLWVVFQPHTYTRTKALLAEFGEALSAADHVVLAKIYPAREQDIYGVSSQDVADEVKKYGTDVIYIDTFSGVEDYLYSHCKEGDLLITMGAGNVTSIGPSLLAR